MAEIEHPGVYVEETGSGKPIEGVPTDALTSADRRRWLVGLAIGGFVMAGLAILLAATRGDLFLELLAARWGAIGVVGLLGVTLLLGVLRRRLEWRRRVAGRAPLPLGRLAVGLLVFLLANLVAVIACAIVLAMVTLAGWDGEVMLTATLNLLVGGVMVQLVLSALRDLSLLTAAARDRGSSSSSRT